jgi:hypothetical protein
MLLTHHIKANIVSRHGFRHRTSNPITEPRELRWHDLDSFAGGFRDYYRVSSKDDRSAIAYCGEWD